MAITDTTTINSGTLQSDPKMVVPAPTQDKTPYESIIQGAITGLPNVQTQVDQATKDNTDLLTKYVAGTGDLTNKEVYSQDQQNLAGVADRKKELDALNAQFNDITAQVTSLGRANSAVPLKVQEANANTGATDIGVAPQQAGELRKNAIKALTLASTADVLGANITNTEARLARAKENAQLAVDLKYKPIEAEVARLKDMLELNTKYILDPAEKKLAEKQTIALNERARILAEKKQDEKDNTELLINANSQGAPASIVANAKSMIAKGAKPADVASALGVYSGDYIGNQLKLKDIKLKDLEWKTKNNEFLSNTGPALAVNADGSIVKGAGPTATDRNVMTIEQLIKKNGKTIPDGIQTQIVTALGVINSLQAFAQSNSTGEVKGFNPVMGAVDSILPSAITKPLKSDKTISNETLAGAINLKVQQWASGANLSEAQTKLVLGMVPTKSDPDNVVKEKIKSLTDMMNGQISADFTASGVKYRPEQADYFDSSIATKVKNAVGSNYQPTEIVDQLKNDPVYGPKIATARANKWTDQQIVDYLQTVQPTQ